MVTKIKQHPQPGKNTQTPDPMLQEEPVPSLRVSAEISPAPTLEKYISNKIA